MLRCRDDCCGQDKLIHASSKQALKAELSGLNTPEFQCSELSELSFSEITKDLQKRDRVWLMDWTAKKMWRLYHYYLLNWVHFGHEKALEKFHFNNAYLMFQNVNKFPKLCIRANLTCKNFTNLYYTIKSTYRQLFQTVISLSLLFAIFALPEGRYTS